MSGDSELVDPKAPTDADATKTAARAGTAGQADRGSSMSGEPSSDPGMSAPARSDGPPLLEHFIILSRLGQGGMGVVFAAYDERLDRKVAIKLMQSGRESEAARARMLQEARAMARLSHPNIVAVHEVGEVDTRIFIAMEYVRGLDLNAWLLAASRPWREVLDAFRRAGEGLRAAHEAGLIHRDFKPHNVMISDDGAIKVLDFGLARAQDETVDDALHDDPSEPAVRGLTRTGAVVGTPAYIAPELHGGAVASERSDQFAFCVALYFGLFGQYPFAGGSVPAVIESIVAGRLRPPPEGSPVPPWLRRAVMRGLSAEPGDRFESMEALLAAVSEDPAQRRRRRWLAGGAVAAVFAGGFAVAQLGAVEAEACPSGAEAIESSWSSSQRAVVGQGLRGSGSAHAEDTAARIEPALDRYAADWAEAFDDACHSHKQGLQSDALYDRRVACLEQRRASLVTLVEVFGQADTAVVDKAVTAVANLPSLARCGDVEALLAEVAPPSEAIADEVAQLRQKLARARAHEDAGRFARAAELTEPVIERAAALGYPPLAAEALLRKGSTEMAAGQGGDADRDLAQAVWDAMAADHDPIAAQAATLRVFARAELLGQPALAAAELPWAKAMVERTADEPLRGLFLNNAGAVYLRNGDTDAAVESFRASFDLRSRVLPPQHPDLALSLANLGRAELAMMRPAEGAQTLRNAAQRIESALGPRHPHRALVATILSSALTDLGRWAEAEAELNVAEQIYEGRPDDGPMARYHVRVARGRMAAQRRDHAAAREHFGAALELATMAVGPTHPMLIDARLGQAQAMVELGEREQGLARGRAALDGFREAVGVSHPYFDQARVVLAQIEVLAGDAERAVPRLRAVLAADEASGDSDPVARTTVVVWLARAQQQRGNFELAEGKLARGVEALSPLVPASARPLVEARLRLGLLLSEREQFEQAADYLEAARAGLAAVRQPDDPELAWLTLERDIARQQAQAQPISAQQREQAQRQLSILRGQPGWAAEIARVDRWLGD